MGFGLMTDDRFLDHRSRYDHPERPARLTAIMEDLSEDSILMGSVRLPAREATLDELSRVHDEAHIGATLSAIEKGWGYLDPDTFFSPGTKDAALLAAGGTIDLARAVYRSELDFGFALNRPPGHHATRTRCMGFCLFNHIAAAAAALLDDGVERILIFDWDVHHGNGTQQQFYDNPDVLYISLHQWPHFPGSGLSDETGAAAGLGRTINIPFPPGMRDADYVMAFERLILPVLRAFSPEHILVSAGFDAHERDPLAGMKLSSRAYRYMAGHLRKVASDVCDGRISFYLEGGYDFTALTESTVSMCEGMAAGPIALDASTSCDQAAIAVERTIRAVSREWKGIF